MLKTLKFDVPESDAPEDDDGHERTSESEDLLRQSFIRRKSTRQSLFARFGTKASVSGDGESETSTQDDENYPARKSIDSIPFDGNYNVCYTYGVDPASLLKVSISETEHIRLFSLESSIAHSDYAKDDAECDLEWLQAKREFATTETCTQTPIVRSSNVGCNLGMPSNADVSTYINNEILYDAYHSSGEEDSKDWDSGSKALVLNRLMASNQQRPLQVSLDQLPLDPLKRDINFTYSCKILRILADPALANCAVTDIARNHAIPAIYAAAISTNQAGPKGAVAVFSLKNTVLVERIHRLSPPVLCLEVSKKSPNILAVGCQDGSLSIIDISGPATKVLVCEPPPSLDMVRLVQWWTIENNEDLLYCIGCHVKRMKRPFLARHKMDMMSVVDSKNEGLHQIEVPLTTGPAVTSMLRVAGTADLYILAAADGCLRVCSIHSHLEYLQVFEAHEGVVSSIRAVPHNSKLFVTCGSDGTAKLWALDIAEPLLTMHTNDGVGAMEDLLDVVWSPLHATVAVAASSSNVYVWDIRRRTHSPMSVFSTGHRLLNIQFSSEGEYLLLGTDNGAILFIGLEGMPFPEVYKPECLCKAILRKLKLDGKEHLIGKLRTLETFKQG